MAFGWCYLAVLITPTGTTIMLNPKGCDLSRPCILITPDRTSRDNILSFFNFLYLSFHFKICSNDKMVKAPSEKIKLNSKDEGKDMLTNGGACALRYWY